MLTEVNNVPANSGVILKGSLYATVSTTANTDMDDNDLLVSDGNVCGSTGIYALAVKNGKPGFYPVASSVTIPAGKAYLNINSSSTSKGFTFSFDDDPTGLISIDNDELVDGEWLNGKCYNLAGQRIQKMQKGVNIINGKKVLY